MTHAGKIVTSICENDGFRLAPFSGGFWAHLAILDRVVQGLAPLRQPIHARPLVAVATPAGPEPGNYHAG